jgi:hypothetical protein
VYSGASKGRRAAALGRFDSTYGSGTISSSPVSIGRRRGRASPRISTARSMSVKKKRCRRAQEEHVQERHERSRGGERAVFRKCRDNRKHEREYRQDQRSDSKSKSHIEFPLSTAPRDENRDPAARTDCLVDFPPRALSGLVGELKGIEAVGSAVVV